RAVWSHSRAARGTSAGWVGHGPCGSQPNRCLADRIVQHGADAGPRYNDYRALMKYPRVSRFEQINSDPLVLSELRRIYSDVDRIEYFAGLFAEELPPRSAVPPLIGRMVAADAFSHALTNPMLFPHVYHVGTFATGGMEVIEKTAALADLLARNDVVPAGTRIS